MVMMLLLTMSMQSAKAVAIPTDAVLAFTLKVPKGHKIKMAFKGKDGYVYVAKGDRLHVQRARAHHSNDEFNSWHTYKVEGDDFEGFKVYYTGKLLGVKIEDNGNHGDIQGGDFSGVPYNDPVNGFEIYVLHSGYITSCVYDQMMKTLPYRQKFFANDRNHYNFVVAYDGNHDEDYVPTDDCMNDGAKNCNSSIAKDKGWTFGIYYNVGDDHYIVYPKEQLFSVTGTGTGCMNTFRYIDLDVKQGQTIDVDIPASIGTITLYNGSEIKTLKKSYNHIRTSITAKSNKITFYGSVEEFSCKNNGTKITGIKVHNGGLKKLDCSNNAIKNLNLVLEGFSQLEELDCSNNLLTELDFKQVENFLNFKKLNCSNNNLTSLTYYAGADEVDCSNNKLTKVSCRGLKKLNCSNNLLTELEDVTVSKEFNCSNNQLTKLTFDDYSHYKMGKIDCSNNQLTELKVYECSELNCSNNKLTDLDIKKGPDLMTLDCSNNELTRLDITHNPILNKIIFYNNSFTKYNRLNKFYCSLPDRSELSQGVIIPVQNSSSDDNDFVKSSTGENATNKNWAIRYSNNSNITTTGSYNCETGKDIDMDKYIVLDVVNGKEITIEAVAGYNNTPIKIVSGSNKIHKVMNSSLSTFKYTTTSDKVTIYGDLRIFSVGNNSSNRNKITGVDISHNTSLKKLDCSGVKTIKSLKLGYNSNFETLMCSDNAIISLDVSKNRNLKGLFCAYNKISQLDLSKSTKLKALDCSENNLTSLDVSNCNPLWEIKCGRNNFDKNAVDNIYCSLADRVGNSQPGLLYILDNTTDANHNDVLQSTKQNALDKNWKVMYYHNGTGYLYHTDIPATTGNYVCNGSTAVNDVYKGNIVVYPNPVKDVLHIDKVDSNDIQVEIYNTAGDKLVDVRNKNRISVSHLSSGVYFVKVITDKGVYSKKLIKK